MCVTKAQITKLEDKFYPSDASSVALDLKAMGQQAAAEFRGTHPEIKEEAVQALAWSYTLDVR
ncbi:hypothetical protein O7631_18225 [Micromonospora sp. WMMD967]|uniref:hypothetical protein n=1 Tax=Micromonospora sp. WMMD967 TaxID=3016101 RepID=UPI0024173CC8|nr:hypothetical protein [Micromonospora sp. WMMD967]MDG4838456.1 hypothetical protein [Micromonospora sp. WMMD967]